jgi:RimJ/RimL family protein N-acetyltransferase
MTPSAPTPVTLRVLTNADYDWLYALLDGSADQAPSVIVDLFRGQTPSPAEFVRRLWENVQVMYVAESAYAILGLLVARRLNLADSHVVVHYAADPTENPEAHQAAFTEFLLRLSTRWKLHRIFVEVPSHSRLLFLQYSRGLFDECGCLVEDRFHNGRYWDTHLFSVRIPQWLQELDRGRLTVPQTDAEAQPPLEDRSSYSAPREPPDLVPIDLPQPPSLVGRRTRLRALEEVDYPLLYQIASSPEVAYRWRQRGQSVSPASFASSLWDGVLSQFAVTHVLSGDVLGLVTAFGANFADGHVHIATLLKPTAQRRGAPLEAVTLFMEYLFRTFPLRKIYGESVGFNFAQVPTSTGNRSPFVEEAVLPEHVYWNGRYWDTHIVATTRAQWDAHVAHGDVRTGSELGRISRHRDSSAGT